MPTDTLIAPKQSKRRTNEIRKSAHKELRLSLRQAEHYFHTTRDTIRRNADLQQIKPDSNGRYSVFDIHRILSGDLRFERTRRERAEADRAEVAAARDRGEVIHVDQVQAFIRNTFQPVREDVVALPGLLAAKCNPENPELARQTLTEWTDQFIKRRRESAGA
jgi:hypothetical protein